MNIKKVDDKPMVIHTKEKAKIHTHEPKQAAIKGSNVYTVNRGPKVVNAQIRQMDSKLEIAQTMADLGRTVGNASEWTEIYFASNKTLSARFCTDIRQLENFLQGEMNADQNHRFDENNTLRLARFRYRRLYGRKRITFF